MKKILLSLLLLCTTVATALAQGDGKVTDKNYQQILDDPLNYPLMQVKQAYEQKQDYKARNADPNISNKQTGNDAEEFEGEDHLLQRGIRFYMDRLDSNGMIVPWNIKAAEVYQEYKATQAANKLTGAPVTANWKAIGPNNLSTTGYLHSNSIQASGIGRIDCIAIDPTNDDIMYAGSPTGGLWKTINKGQNWKCMTDGLDFPVGISDIAIDPTDPQIIYAATGDKDNEIPSTWFLGVLKSIDGGQSWRLIKSGFTIFNQTLAAINQVQRLVINPHVPSQLILLTENNFYLSIDNGEHWTKKGANNILDTIEYTDLNILKTPAQTKVYFTRFDAILNQCFLYSIQDFTGAIVKQKIDMLDGKTCSNLKLNILPGSPNEIFIAYNKQITTSNNVKNMVFGGLIKSIDEGLSWSTVKENTCALTSCNENYLGYTIIDSLSQSSYAFTLGIDTSATTCNKPVIYIGGVDNYQLLYDCSTASYISQLSSCSDNQNLCDHDQLMHADQHCITFNSGGELFVGNDGGVFKCTDKVLNKWEPICNGLQVSEIYNSSISNNANFPIWMAAQDNGIGFIKSITRPVAPTTLYEKVFGGDGLEAANVNENVYGITNGDQYFIKTSKISVEAPDNKNTINTCTNPLFIKAGWSPMSAFYVNPNNADEAVFGTRSLYYTQDAGGVNGEGWKCAFNTPFPGVDNAKTPFVRKITPSNQDPKVIYALISILSKYDKFYHLSSSKSEILKSPNNGRWFKPEGYLNTPKLTSIAYGKWNNTGGLFGSQGGYEADKKVWFKPLNNQPWINIDDQIKLPNVPVNCIVYDTVSLNNDLYVGTDAGVYYRNETDDWVEFNTGMPKCLITDLDIDYERGSLIASTFGRGLWQCDLLSSTKVEIISEAGPTICTGETIELQAIGISGTYSWSNGATVNPCAISTPGTYTVTVTSQANITASASINIGLSTDTFHVYWENQYGGNKNDMGTGIVYADDKIFITGTTFSDDPNSNVAGDVTANVYTSAIKAKNGVQLWHKTMGGPSDDKAGGIALNSENDLIIGATTASSGSLDVPSNSSFFNGDDFWVFKLNTDGSLGKSGKTKNDFNYTFDESINDNLNSVITGPGGTIFLGGCSVKANILSFFDKDFYVKRISGIDGKVSGSYKFQGNDNDEILGMTYVSNGSNQSIYMTGYSNSDPSTGALTNFFYSMWPVKFGGTKSYRDFFNISPQAFNLNVGWTVGMNASSGNIKCNSIFGGENENHGNCITSSLDKKIFIAGESKSKGFHMASVQKFGGFDIYARKQRTDGLKHDWVVSAGGTGTDIANAILTTTENGIIVAGSSNSPNNGNDIVNAKGGFDIFLVNYDANGTKLGSINLGDANDDEAKAMVWDTDSSNFYVCGTKSKSPNDKDIYVAKITCNTCPKPYKGLIADNITTTDADLNWETRSCPATYEVWLRKKGVTDNYEVTTANSGIFITTALTPATEYEWKVRSKCANGNYSVFSPLQYFTTMSLRDAVSLTKDAAFNLMVYPNPNNGNFNLHLDVLHDATGVMVIMDELGRTIYQHELTVIEGKNVIGIANTGLAQGTYFAKVTIEGEGSKAIRVAVF